MPDSTFGLVWPGKQQAAALAESASAEKLVEQPGESVDWESTRNIVIEGDNLAALKIMVQDLAGKVGMIYIDPPYNTGNEFVFKDDFRQTRCDYAATAQLAGEDASAEAGRLHSDWLSMMYPRLILARKLLTPGGAIFISIDDQEVAHLQLIMREIYGEDNVETLVWDKEAEGKSGTLRHIKTVRRVHEYIVVGYRDRAQTQFVKVREALPDREGSLQTANLAVNTANERSDHPNYFAITNPSGQTFTRQWKWDQERIAQLIEQDLIYWGRDGRRQPRLIIPTDERRTTYLRSILAYGGTTVGRKDVEKHFQSENTDPATGRLKNLRDRISFDYPKPVILLRKLIETATVPDDIVLDFFAGSGSTAEAVLEANARDGGTRCHISVQLPEATAPGSPAAQHGFSQIAELTRERIRRAGQHIQQLYEDDLVHRSEPLDIGFRAYVLG